MRPTLIPAFFLALSASLAAPSGARAEVAQVAATIDFSGGSPKLAEAAADALLSALLANDGQTVRLSLTLTPAQGGEADYVLDNTRDQLRCGDGSYGLIENADHLHHLTFGHPAHSHALFEIVVGDRIRFPDQDLRCSIENYTDQVFTDLQLTGYFRVAMGVVPTAHTVHLFPVNPG